MAVRLARAFKTTPQFWLNLQSNHVVWELSVCITSIAFARSINAADSSHEGAVILAPRRVR